MANQGPDMTLDKLIASFKPLEPSEVTRFFGVQLAGHTDENPIVVCRLSNLRQILAHSPTCRFKEFVSFENAVEYSRFHVDHVADLNFIRAPEPRSSFPKPTKEEKELLVTAVSRGDVTMLRWLAWKNPLLLLTTDDSPQCYRGTWRQTVLHLAAQAENFPVFCAVMEILENPAFTARTQLTEFEDLPERRKVMVRNYLNNRAKFDESVLDFAIKYGVVEFVDFLTVHPLCELTTQRKLYRANPLMVCSKSSLSAEKKTQSTKDILAMLTGRWYIPLLTPVEIFGKTIIGQPLPVDTMRDHLKEGRLAGFLGPLTEGECRTNFDLLKRCLRTAARLRGESRTVPDSDGENKEELEISSGEEEMRRGRRVGERKLKRTEGMSRGFAKRRRLPWKEWWGFFGEFCDVDSGEGLAKVEAFLAGVADHPAFPNSSDSWPNPIAFQDNLTIVEILSLFYTRSPKSRHSPLEIAASPPNPPSIPEPPEDLPQVFYTPPSSPEPSETALHNFIRKYSQRSALFLDSPAKPGFSDYDLYDALKSAVIPDDFRYVLAWRAQMDRDVKNGSLTDAMSRLFL